MSSSRFSSVTEQVATHLGGELQRGRWREVMPGRNILVQELGVSGRTVELALQKLEKQGMLAPQGPGRPRKIVLMEEPVLPALRVGILEHSPADLDGALTLNIKHSLREAGHNPSFTPKTLTELDMRVPRIAKMVEDGEADAWLIGSGSREVLKWFSDQEAPTFAIFGRMAGLPIASVKPNMAPAIEAATRRLIELEHRRIVLVIPTPTLTPTLGRIEHRFFKTLEEAGIEASRFNLPNWEYSPTGFRKCLDSLFAHTPPTALIIDTTETFHAAKDYLARQGVLAPGDISLVCCDWDPQFSWHKPGISHVRWDHRPIVRRIVDWTNNVALRKEDRRQTLTKAEFVEGGTIGPAPKA